MFLHFAFGLFKFHLFIHYKMCNKIFLFRLLHQQMKVQEFLMVRAKIYSRNTVPVRIIYEDMYLLSLECQLVYIR